MKNSIDFDKIGTALEWKAREERSDWSDVLEVNRGISANDHFYVSERVAFFSIVAYLRILPNMRWSDNLIILSLGCYNGTLNTWCTAYRGNEHEFQIVLSDPNLIAQMTNFDIFLFIFCLVYPIW